MSDKKRKPRPYLNPYLAGFLLGITLLLSFLFTGRGVGASGAVKSSVAAVVNTVAPEHTANSKYFSNYIKEGNHSPLKSWLVFEILGVIIGGMISGAVTGRLQFTVETAPGISKKRRLIVVFFAGIILGLGSSLGRGCASGAALSGMAVLSTSGFLAFLSIFGSAFLFAYFVRKLWTQGGATSDFIE